MGKFALGGHGDKSIAKSPYYAVAKFSGDNNNAMGLMEAAQKAWAMHSTL